MVDTVFEDVLVVVVVDDIDIPDGAEEDLLSEVADLFVAVVVVGVVAESDDDAGKVEEIQIFKKNNNEIDLFHSEQENPKKSLENQFHEIVLLKNFVKWNFQAKIQFLYSKMFKMQNCANETYLFVFCRRFLAHCVKKRKNP